MSKAARAQLGLTDGAKEIGIGYLNAAFLGKGDPGAVDPSLSAAWDAGRANDRQLSSMVDQSVQLDMAGRRGPEKPGLPHARVRATPPGPEIAL